MCANINEYIFGKYQDTQTKILEDLDHFAEISLAELAPKFDMVNKMCAFATTLEDKVTACKGNTTTEEKMGKLQTFFSS